MATKKKPEVKKPETAEKGESKNKYFDFVPSGGGRPKMILNANGKSMIEVLAGFLCTDEEIAATLSTTVDTLLNANNKETFSECKEKGQCRGKVSLRRMQFRLAEKNATMAIWLGRNLLGQTDRTMEDDEESRKERAAEMRQFAKMSAPSKEEVAELYSGEDDEDVQEETGE